MRRRKKLSRAKSSKMFAKGVMRQHPKNRTTLARGGIRL